MRPGAVEAWPVRDPQDVETISGTSGSTQRTQQGIG